MSSVEPKTSFIQESWGFKIVLEADGKLFGFINARKRDGGIVNYSIFEFRVYDEYRGKGYGSQLLNELTSRLDQEKKSASLSDYIEEGSPAAGIYERRGWVATKEGSSRLIREYQK